MSLLLHLAHIGHLKDLIDVNLSGLWFVVVIYIKDNTIFGILTNA